MSTHAQAVRPAVLIVGTIDRVGGDDAAAEPGEGGTAPPAVASLLRRIRRTADVSQRELAEALGLSRSTVARAETGDRDLPATVLARAAQLAGLRLALLDAGGHEVAGMTDGAVRDQAGRRFPAHLDVRYGDQAWWYGDQRYDREQPWYTFDRARWLRDRWRARTGTPEDHQEPQAGDSPAERVRAREVAGRAARAARAEAARAQRLRLGLPDPLEWVCSCPSGCDELLLTDPPHHPWARPPVHVDTCPCGCDVS